MPRPITLFTGQWADLPLAELLPKVKEMGYDGVELACWGDHFEVDRALAEADYAKKKWALLQKHGMACFAISNHLVGQAVCDLIDERHKAILPAEVWGDGKAEGVRQRAAEAMKQTARAARKFFNAKPVVIKGFEGKVAEAVESLAAIPGITREQADVLVHHGFARLEDLLQADKSDLAGIKKIGEQAATILKAARAEAAKPGRKANDKSAAIVNGFTGSSIWHSLYAFPPTNQEYWSRGFADFAKRWLPILDVFEKENVNFALEVHPTEIAFDIASGQRALEAVKQHPRFGFNYDPSHLGYQGVSYVKFIREFTCRIFHVHMKDVWWGHGDGTVGVFGGHTDFTDPRRFWDFRSIGHGDIKFEDIIVALNDVGYRGPLSVEWEDGRMDRVHGATESCAYVRKLDFAPNQAAFDAAFSKKK